MVFAFLSLFSCAARINGSLSADGSAVMSVNVSLEPQMATLVRRLSAADGQETGMILDGQAIAASISGAPGVASASLRNTASAAVNGTVTISHISDFLSAADGSDFILFEHRDAEGRCEININRDNGPQIISLLSPEIEKYLNALWAPILTGEDISKEEYLEVVVSFYNKTISDEIASSRIRASIDFPGVITGVRGGTFSGRRAEFDIPLLDLLVLESPVNLEVRWR